MSEQFDKAFKLFNDRKFADAVSAFDNLLADESIPVWQQVRIKQFKTISQRQLTDQADQEVSLRSVSFLMNKKAFDKAAAMLEKLDVSKGEKLFLKSEMAIEQGKKEEAITLLNQAIEADHHNVGYALNSPSYAEHLQDEAFQFLRQDKEDAA